MSWEWVEEQWSSDKGYRIPYVAYVGSSAKKWWHVSLYDQAADLWRRQPELFHSAIEARIYAEQKLEEEGRKPGEPCPGGAAKLLAQAEELIRGAEALLKGHAAQSSAEYALLALAEVQSEL